MCNCFDSSSFKENKKAMQVSYIDSYFDKNE